jgi:hypothetical protein
MRHTKFTVLVLNAAIAALSVTPANAGTVKINGVQYESRSGAISGEINVTLTGISGVTDRTFGTFCVEVLEHINLGYTYDAQANTAAIKGGEAVSDPLDPKTAWLFNQYLTGAIVLDTNAKRTDFQYAIWALEGEFVNSGATWTPEAQAYYDLTGASNVWTDIGSIRVLNLGTAEDGFQYQDLLVPEPATLSLFAIGAAALLRRRKS